MFCPRCGEETDGDARYCGSCGAELPRPGKRDAEERSAGERIGDLVGRTRRERMITGGTVLAIAIAIAAFFALDTDTDESVTSALNRGDAEAVDAACIVAKQTIADAAGRVAEAGGANLEEYSAAVLRSIVEFRSQVRSLPANSGLDQLDAALLEAATEAGELSRLAREDPSQAADQATTLEEATGGIEAAIAELGLTGCAQVQTVPVAPQ